MKNKIDTSSAKFNAVLAKIEKESARRLCIAHEMERRKLYNKSYYRRDLLSAERTSSYAVADGELKKLVHDCEGWINTIEPKDLAYLNRRVKRGIGARIAMSYNNEVYISEFKIVKQKELVSKCVKKMLLGWFQATQEEFLPKHESKLKCSMIDLYRLGKITFEDLRKLYLDICEV